MKLKIKLNSKDLFRIIYLLFVIANIVILVLLFRFLKEYVYGSVFVDETFLQNQTIKVNNDLDLDKFDKVVNDIEKRQTRGGQQVEPIRNPF